MLRSQGGVFLGEWGGVLSWELEKFGEIHKFNFQDLIVKHMNFMHSED